MTFPNFPLSFETMFDGGRAPDPTFGGRAEVGDRVQMNGNPGFFDRDEDRGGNRSRGGPIDL